MKDTMLDGPRDGVFLLDYSLEVDARALLERCCGCARWVSEMVSSRPFGSTQALLERATLLWSSASKDEVLEALSHHPRIGANLDELRARFASTATWAEGEQAGAKAASEVTLEALRAGNTEYEAKFGHTFVVCATGKSAEEMLALLRSRLGNSAELEWTVAREEQGKITALRLTKLVRGEPS